jgi:hypothetical protein
MTHRDAGAVVPIVLIMLFFVVLALTPMSRRVGQLLDATDQTIRYSTTVDRIGMVAFALGRVAALSPAGLLVPVPADAGGVPAAAHTLTADEFGEPYAYCPAAAYDSSADPLLAVVSAGRDRSLATSCTDALTGAAQGDDILRQLSVYEASLIPHQVQPENATINSMWRSRCASIGVIQNLTAASRCSEFTPLWSSFAASNAGLFP